MAKTTPAHIIYTKEGTDNEVVIDFHAVVSEDHEASAKITKYPVQTGLHISNHSIRNNRVVSLTGVISNMIMNNATLPLAFESPADTVYGADSQKAVFGLLEDLILTGQECKVVTNLGIYNNVVFNKFKTSQSAGKVDSMEFTISGEEIIKVDQDNSSAPIPLAFSVVTGSERNSYEFELADLGYETSPCDEISVASYQVGEDFSIDQVNSAGKPVKVTYLYKGIDPSTGEPIYEVHVDDNSTEVYSDLLAEPSNDPCREDNFGDTLLGGVNQLGRCLLNEASEILLDEAEELIDGAMGKLIKSAYGAFYDVTSAGDIGSEFLAAGIGCIVRTATRSTEGNTSYIPSEGLPNVDNIVEGVGVGLGIREPSIQTITLAQIKCACTDGGNDLEVDQSLLGFIR